MPPVRCCRCLCFATLICVLALHVCQGEENYAWQAQWIVPAGDSKTNSWWCYRRQVVIDDSSQPCTARIACDSKYWLWINGELIVFEGQLKRGPTPQDTYYDEVDLTGRFRPGKNTIAVLVWYFGREGMSHKSSGQVGLVFDATIGTRRILSDAGWRVIRHPAYVQTGEPHPNWRLPESNIGYDARLDIGAWKADGFDDTNWPFATERGVPPVAPWNRLVRRSIPFWRDNGLREYDNASDLPKISDGRPIVAKLPYNAQITPYLEIVAQAGQLVDLRTDNYMGGSEPGVRAEYTTRDGRQAYESLGWMNGHEVIYSLPAGVEILDLKYRETGYDTDLAGSFRCNDEALNTLWRKAQRTLYLEMRDGYPDCPCRERAQWWGDVTLELQQAFYALDRRSSALARKAMLELTAWQRPSGVLHSPIPAGNYDQELPMQMLAAVGRFGFWEYYRHTGDVEVIKQVYPAVKRYLALWILGEDGLVIQRPGDWTFGDWGENKDMPLLYNAWYYLALEGQLNMARLVGDDEVVADIVVARTTLRERFNQTFWTGKAYKSPEHEGPPDDRGNALAVVSGLASRDKYSKLASVLATERHASPYMEKYVLEALIRMDQHDAALERMRDRYAAMIESPITTLWEGWGIGPEGYGGGSYNHAWSGGPLTLLSQYFAGVDPIVPGYAEYRVAPQLASLEFVDAVVPSPVGEIRVRVDRGPNRLRIDLTAPPTATAEVVVPWTKGQALAVNGVEIGQIITLNTGIPNGTVVAIGDGTATLALQPGKYEILVGGPK